MADWSWLLLLGWSWIGIGLVLAVVLGRRGHDSFGWLVIGSLLGPFGIILAFEAVSSAERLATRNVADPVTTRAVTGAAGTVDVLAGVDGSPEAHAAIHAVMELLGSRLGRLTLATVVPFDCLPVVERTAAQTLYDEAARMCWLGPGMEIVHGHPARALAEAARQGGFDVLVVGRKGVGHAHLFGSTAQELAESGDVPVLIGASAR